MRGELTFLAREGQNHFRTLRLTVCDNGDRRNGEGVAEQRRKRIEKLLDEAKEQGGRLRHKDLMMIMLVSRSTLKRDLEHLKCNVRKGSEEVS